MLALPPGVQPVREPTPRMPPGLSSVLAEIGLRHGAQSCHWSKTGRGQREAE